MARTQHTKEILLPIGRIVKGNLYKASPKDAEGKLRVVKDGPNAGQPNPQFYFAVAIAKTPGKPHWAHEAWGAQIWAIGNSCFPKIAESATFSWKIIDGDSTVPNKKGNRPCDNEGYPGHWVVSFNSSYAPKIVNHNGTEPITQPDAVQPGDYVQVNTVVDGNMSTQNPGVYINHQAVSFKGYSAKGRISQGKDPSEMGFSNDGAPPDLVSTPVDAPSAPAAAIAAPAATPAVSVPPAPVPGSPAAAPPVYIAPKESFLAPAGVAPPVGVAPPPAAVAPPPGPVYVMTNPGTTREQWIAAGWTDAQLIAAGHMRAA